MARVPQPLNVDTTLLTNHGNRLVASASTIPTAPEPFSVTGSDAISSSIRSQVSLLETPIITGLRQLKETATKTANDFVAAAAAYLQSDATIAQGILDVRIP